MVGGVETKARTDRAPATVGNVVLSVSRLAVANDLGLPAACEIDLEVRQGEILGIGGVVGAGQVELLEAIAGVRPSSGGTILLGTADITMLSTRARQRLGVGYIPPDRRRDGLVGSLSIVDNLALAADGIRPAVSRSGVLDTRAMTEHAKKSIARFDIRCGGMSIPCSKLSGGNQQKVILARELSRRPRIVLCCYPTRGLDFAATAAVHAELREAAAGGAAVIVVSLDLAELLDLADRVLVMQGGRICGGGSAADLTEEKLGLLIGGETMP
jgi:simple sugar transport system ATP-binding protein